MSEIKIVELICEKEEAVIYRGYRVSSGQPVIVKQLHREYAMPEDIKQLAYEYEITKKIDSEGIIKVYGVETLGSSNALVLEDIGGISLQAYLSENELTLSNFFKIAIKLCEIVGEIHHCNIIHRDLKPGNIIIVPQTLEVKITDFSIAVLCNNFFVHQNSLAGSYQYMSPEQTGRTNCAVDYRADFYSLGVTFYEMLSGQLPFQAQEPLEWLHAHLAKTPAAPNMLNQEIPVMLSEIVMKLLAKKAEARYQSSYGIKADLEICSLQWEKTGTISEFALGGRDVPGKLQISSQLYGREEELRVLMGAFNRISLGNSELALISGFAGVGKTTLVNEVVKSIIDRGGFFSCGRFEQLKKDVPYASLIQVFEKLIRQILAKDKDTNSLFKAKIMNALGANGRVITELIPEVKLIIGEQPPIQPLLPEENKNRFLSLFKKFVYVFASKDHPLVIFLDDLHWMDVASLQLLQFLVADPNNSYLLFIGSYRQNEVMDTNPFMLALSEIKKSGIAVNQLSLSPLNAQHIVGLLSATLCCQEEKAVPLAQQLYKKTDGNPFFLKQLIQSIYEANLLFFNAKEGCWDWDLDAVAQWHKSDNVVDLMAEKLHKLPLKPRNVLMAAACIGNIFDLNSLSVLCENSCDETLEDLSVLIQEGLILHDGSDMAYAFIHNRVQQAAYAIMPESKKKEAHLKIGRLIINNINPGSIKEKIFEIVDHINFSLELVDGKDEWLNICEYNLIAGVKAKESGAYSSALSYLLTGISLLPKNCWQQCYDLTYSLYFECSQCEYLCGNFNNAEKLFEILLSYAATNLKKSEIYLLKMAFAANQGNHGKVIRLCLKALNLLGFRLSSHPSKNLLFREIITIKLEMFGKSAEDLCNLPSMNNPEQIRIMELLMYLSSTANSVNQDFYILIMLKMARFSLKFGNTASSAFAFGGYGILCGSGLGDLKTAYQMEQLAVKLCEKYGNPSVMCRVYLGVGAFLRHWEEHAEKDIYYFNKAYQYALEAGDLLFAGYALAFIMETKYFLGSKLDEIIDICNKYLEFTKRMKLEDPTMHFEIYRQLASNLKGLTHSCRSFDDDIFSEEDFLMKIRDSNFNAMMMIYSVCKLRALYHGGYYGESVELALESSSNFNDIRARIISAEYYFYFSLALVALMHRLSAEERSKYWSKLKKNQRQLKKWADACNANFLHKYLLVEAEIAHLQRKYLNATTLYEKSIEQANKNGFQQDEAIANELAAKFFLSKGNKKVAKLYFMEAYHKYLHWGAEAKANSLKEEFVSVLSIYFHAGEKSIFASGQKDSAATTVKLTDKNMVQLDLDTIIKASRAISSEIGLQQLLKNLMDIIIESAGAQKGFLILEKEGALCIEAQGGSDLEESILLQSLPLDMCKELSTAIVQYVARTKEHVVLSDASMEGIFKRDSYIISNQSKSILCIPVVDHNKLIGIVYLENNLSTHAFTFERVELIKILSSQAAISIENARLYSSLKQSRDEIERWNHVLEQEVRQRAGAIKNLLNNAGQGFLSFGESLMIDEEYSQECINIFGSQIDRNKFCDLIFAENREQRELSETILTEIFNEADQSKIALFLPLLPEEVVINQRYIKIEYKFLIEEQPLKRKKIMAILTDFTEKRLLEIQMKEEESALRMFVRVVSHDSDFNACVREFNNFCKNRINNLIISNRAFQEILSEVYRQVHTFKGSFHQFGLLKLTNKLHQLETELSNLAKNIEESGISDLLHCLNKFNLGNWPEEDEEIAVLESMLGKNFLSGNDGHFVMQEKIIEVERKMLSVLSPPEVNLLLPEIRKLRARPFRDLMKDYPEYFATMADKLEKLVNPLVIEGGEFLVETERYYSFAKSLGHIFRNMLDHGIESVEERIALNKIEYGKVSCVVDTVDNQIVVTIRDDGRGLDIQKIRRVSIEKGIHSEEKINNLTDEEIVPLIFADNFSTKTEVTELSGRGVGLAAVRNESERLGGKIEAAALVDAGTEFRIVLPYCSLAEEATVSIPIVMNALFDAANACLPEMTGILINKQSRLREVVEVALLDVTSFVQVRGILHGVFVMTTTKNFAHEMLTSYAKGSADFKDGDLEDMLGEVLNILTGRLPKMIPELEDRIMLGLPFALSARRASVNCPQREIYTFNVDTDRGEIIFSFIANY